MPSVSMEGAKATAVFVVIVALAVLFLAGHYTVLDREKATLDKQLSDARAEKATLDNLKRQVEEFEKKKQLLTRKINIIEALKKNQTGPVTMLNALATTVESSGTLWLTSFTNDGAKISVDGVAGNVNTVADFITNLKRSGYFKNVEIQQSYEDDTKAISTFVFSITAEIAGSEPPAGTAPAAPPAGAKT